MTGILCEHFATVRGQEGFQHFASILLRRLDFALFESCDSPATEGLFFCRTGAVVFEFRLHTLHLSHMAARSNAVIALYRL